MHALRGHRLHRDAKKEMLKIKHHELAHSADMAYLSGGIFR
ncbi:MAG: hypothetical protein WC651_04265 [Candidatus Gracilibacteria bacterium]